MKNLLLTLLLISTSLTGFCTVWTINDSGLTFTPATITINLGDTVNFVLSATHNAREVSQATWNANGTTALAGGFQAPFGGGTILPAQLGVGTHYYVCTPHASFGMKGTIIVQSCATPATPGTMTGNAAVCSTSSNTYSVAAVSGATSYTWTLPGGWTGTSTTNSITTTASATSGNITVSANNACGSSSVRTLAVSVTAAPATPGAITGNATLCPASAKTYSVAAVSGATSYTWTLPGGWTGTSTTNSITTTAGTTSGNITVSANNACGSSSVRTLAVSVTAAPATPGAITGNASLCPASANTYSVAAVSGATSYTWNLPGGWTGTSTTNSITATAGATSGNITVSANNACG
ncbi:MAG: plastocyanin/azurin family copper-binding protein, partial [Bacteroidia bacterium]|nr:plastocyanin/azurin family copper-binding protein [Bacteroidia bacterium]